MEGEQPLVGLVSGAAEELYARLAHAGGARIGTGCGEVDLDSPAARELFNNELAYRTPVDRTRVHVVSRTVALQLLLARRHSETRLAYEAMLSGWERLGALLDPTLGITDRGSSGAADQISILTHDQEISRLAAELCTRARKDIRRVVVASGSPWVVTVQVQVSAVSGVRVRTLYDRAHATASMTVANPPSAREEARIRNHLPAAMVHVDEQAALIHLAGARDGQAAVVTSPQLLRLLGDWFDRTWHAPATTVLDHSCEGLLTPVQARVLRLLAAGMADDAVAETCGITVRTVRRHVGVIVDVLGVQSRFAVGVAAARRGWI